MRKTSKAKRPRDTEQSKRFIETAQKVGADQDQEALDRAFKKIALRGSDKRQKCP